MKKIFILIFIASIFSAYPNMETYADSKKKLIGKWLLTEFSEIDLPKDQKIYYIFQKDGLFTKKMIILDYEEEQKGQWKLKKNDLIIDFPNGKRTVIYTVTFEGETLILRRLGMVTKLKKE